VPEIAIVVAAVAVGFGSGVLSGMLGIGGAVVSTPAVRVLGATPIEAVGSTVPAILPGAVVGVWRYHRAGLVDWRVGLWCGASGSAAAVAGAVVASSLPEPRWLMVATAALMGASGWSVARSGRRAGRPDPEHAAVPGGVPAGADPPWGALVAMGAVAGFVAGLLGVGGGIVLLPAFTAVLHLPVRRAVAASLVAVALFSVPALVTHTINGNIDWLLAVPLMVGVVPGARLGSRFTVGASDRTVRLVFGVFIGAVAVVYGVAEMAGLHG
jgi:uncharacterized membrane protein YfcA